MLTPEDRAKLLADVIAHPGDHLYPSDPYWSAVADQLIIEGAIVKTTTGHLQPCLYVG